MITFLSFLGAIIPKFILTEFPKGEENFIDYFMIFSLILIKKFERKISLIIVFVLNKIIFKKIIRDFRFYFVGV